MDIGRISGAVLLAALIFFPAAGQGGSSEPSAADIASVRKAVLDNGLTLITQRDDTAAVTVLEILVKGGKKADPPGKEGLAYLTTRLSLEIPDQSKAQEFMERATQWATAEKGDYTVIHLECLTEHFEATLGVFLEILKDPLFSGMRLDRAKDYMDGQRKIESDDNVNAGRLAHLRMWLAGLGYAGSVFGEEGVLKKVKARDVEAFFANYFAPENMILTAVSDLDEEKLGATLRRNFGSLARNPKAVRSAGASSPSAEKDIVLRKDTRQLYVSLGFGMPPLTAKTYALARILESLLGKGPGSRLWPLRTDLKLAYNVSAQALLMKDGGLLEAYLEVDAAKKDSARDALRKALVDLHEKGVGPDELAETKAMVTTEFLRANETRDRRTGMLGFFEAVGLGCEYFAAFPKEIEGVTTDEINGFIRSFADPANASSVLVGPIK
jgi:zinc protease